MRPGTVAAVVTSCIAAAGGGATYCATQLGDPIGSLFSDKSPPVSPREPKQAEPKQAEPRPEPPPPDQISAPVSQAGQFQPQDPPAPAANQQKQQPAQATPQTSEDTAVTEFGIEGTGETVAPPTSTAPSSSSTPDTSGSDSSSSAPPDEFELERSSG